MLDNLITLPIDTLNSGVPTDRDFIRFDEYNNRTVYISENHAPDSRDLLTFYRTFPNASGTYRGTRKTAVKFTRDFTVGASDGTTVTAPAIIEINFSLPVGVTEAEAVELRQTALALLDYDIIMNKLNVIQSI